MFALMQPQLHLGAQLNTLGGGSEIAGSLSGLLDNCSSELGSEQLEPWRRTR